MLATPIKPNVITKQDDQPIFTVHKYPNRILAVKLRDRPDLKTCMIGFKRYRDALKMSHMIENYRRVHNGWPEFNFEYQDDNVLNLTGTIVQNASLDQLMITEWYNREALITFCAKTYVDFLCMNEVNIGRNGNFVMSGSIHKYEGDYKFYQKHLEDIYDLEDMSPYW
jgi:hypothetical protein